MALGSVVFDMAAGTFITERVRYLLVANNQPLWIALAGVNPWPNEDCPPILHPALHTLPGLIGFVQVTKKHIVYRSEKGELELPYGRYRIMKLPPTPENIAALRATNLYYEGVLDRNLVVSFNEVRAVALCKVSNLTPLQNPAKGQFYLYEPNIHTVEVVWAASFRSTVNYLGRYLYFQVLREF